MKVKVNDILLQENKVYTTLQINRKPKIYISEPEKEKDKEKNKLLTLLIVDPDAHYPDNPTEKYMIHNLVINTNETIFKYKSPNPPLDSPPHRYFILVYRQSNIIKLDKPISKRNKFDLNEFVKTNKLKKIDEFVFMCKKKLVIL
jgi:phosphatidylethanolamine-binding protein (PEBP) family uncharacterized protein